MKNEATANAYSPTHFRPTPDGYEIRTLCFSDPRGETYRVWKRADGSFDCPCPSRKRPCKHELYCARHEERAAEEGAAILARVRAEIRAGRAQSPDESPLIQRSRPGEKVGSIRL
jgi:hypothetical protein